MSEIKINSDHLKPIRNSISSDMENSDIKSKTIGATVKRRSFFNDLQAISAEFVATALLVLFGCMSCVQLDGATEPTSLNISLTFGVIVLLNVQAFGHLSGAHMNPAVTFGALVWGLIPCWLAACFIGAQILGGIAGYGVLVGISPVDLSLNGTCVTQLGPGVSEGKAVAVEVILTFALVLICCGLWRSNNANASESAPIKLGLAVTMLCLAGGAFTGSGLNPARSLGPAVWTGRWASHWVYWIGPILGGITAPVVYKYVMRSHEK